MSKLLIALAVAYFGWLLWRGPFYRPKPRPASRPLPDTAPRDVAQARSILGLGEGADEAAIRAAHRRLVARVHPDHGGSEELTRHVNMARDLLLARLRD